MSKKSMGTPGEIAGVVDAPAVILSMSRSKSIHNLKRVDTSYKPKNADHEWKLLHEFYDDRSRLTTYQALKDLGMGIAANTRPIEVPFLRRIIKRLATVYKNPASRWLMKGGKRLSKKNADQENYLELMERMGIDGKWRNADRKRTLYSQSILRFYPSDQQKCVLMRTFNPYNVIREPSAGDGDCIDADHRFGLCVRKGEQSEAWEYWERAGGVWTMTMLDQNDKEVDLQPFDRSGWIGGESETMLTTQESAPPLEPSSDMPSRDLTNPYPVLPVRVFYVEDPDGQPWIPPRESRAAWQMALNAKANDLMALIRNQAHDDEYFATEEPDKMPDLSGSGVRQAVPKDTQLLTAARNPKIDESIKALNNAAKLAMMAEGLPSSDLDGAKTILTGAALRVQEGELRELREEQLEMFPRDERAVFEIIRAIHNVHAESWGETKIPEDVTLSVLAGDLDTPQDIAVEQAYYHTEIANQFAHPVQWIQARDKVSEDEAIEIWEHTQELFADYPLPIAVAPMPITGPSDQSGRIPQQPGNPGGDKAPMDEPALKKDGPGLQGQPSITQAIKKQATQAA